MTLVPWDMLGKILLAAALGAILGAERDLNARPAGLRTGMLIAMSSCIFTILSAQGFAAFGGTIDPTRIAAQIVTGVGFLGAGAVIHSQNRVIGLTTAAEIWLAAAIGMMVGTGMFALATVTTGIIVVCLFLFAPLSYWLEKKGEQRMKKNHRKLLKK